MNWTILKNEQDYNKANERLMEIFHAEAGTPEDDELALLILLIQNYDNRHYELPEIGVLDYIKVKMEEQGLKNKDLVPVIGSEGHVSNVLSGRKEITLKTARKLKNLFNIPAEMFLNATH